MTAASRALRVVSLIACALVAGLTLAHVLQAPGSRGLSGAAWLQVQHTFYGGFAVVGGVAEVVGLAAAALNAVLLRRRVRQSAASALAAACLLGTLLAYALGNRPANERIASWTAATLPAGWQATRDAWEAAHAVSASLAWLALGVLVIATVFRRE